MQSTTQLPTRVGLEKWFPRDWIAAKHLARCSIALSDCCVCGFLGIRLASAQPALVENGTCKWIPSLFPVAR